MEIQTALEVISAIFAIGIVWGSLNSRIKQLEKSFAEHRDTIERLARVEEKLNLLIQHFIK